MEGHPLETRIRVLIRRSRAWTVWRLACLAASVFGVSLLGAAWLDFLLRLQDRGVRLFLSAALLAGATASVRIGVNHYRRLRFDPLSVARELERRFPTLRGALASAIEFLASERNEMNSTQSGSNVLRRAVIERATRSAESLDFLSVLDGRPVWRASLAACGVWAACAASFGANPAAASLALARVAQPWRELAWPRQHQLTLDASSTKVARGQTATFIVRDAQGRLPSDVRLEVAVVATAVDRSASSVAADPREATPELSEDGREARYRLENITQSVRVRAVGGDDREGDWLTIEVVEPPTVDWRVAQWTPPEYLSEPARPLVQPVRAVAGSRIDLQGTLSRPVKSAVVKELPRMPSGVGGQVERRDAPPTFVPLAVDASGLSLATTAEGPRQWRVVESGVFVVEAEDEQGVTAELARWVIDVVLDSPPVVSLVAPSPQAYATPSAQAAVRGVVRDDFGVERAELQWRIGRKSETGGGSGAVRAGEPASLTLALSPARGAGMNAGEPIPFAGTWSLASGERPAPGDLLEYRVVAWDRKPQVGESEWRRLEIVAEEEFERRLAQREALLLETLRETLGAQRRAAEQTLAAAEEDRPSNGPPPAAEAAVSVERLQAIDLTQRNARKLLSDDQTGLLSAIEALQAALTDNGLASTSVAERWREFRATLSPLVEEELPAIERALGHAVRTRREMPAESIHESLREAVDRQARVVTALERLVERLAPWDRLQRQALDLAEVRAAVDARRGETEQLLVEQGRSGGDPVAQAQARRRLSDELLELGRRVERLLTELRDSRGALPRESDAAQAIDRALTAADAATPSGQLREAGQSLRDNRLGSSLERQADAAETLDRMLDALANRADEAPLSSRSAAQQRRQQELEDWSAAVEPLIAGQSALVAERETPVFSSRPAADVARRWSAQQTQLAQTGDDALARLPTTPAFQFALRSAVVRMRRAARDMEKLADDTAFAAAGEARQRLEALRSALRSAAENGASDAASPPPQTPVAKDGAAQPEESGRPLSWTEIQLLRDLQVELSERTAAVEQMRQPDGTLDADGRRMLRELTAEQGELLGLLKEMLP
ncbi:MAG: hypothetical protein U0939_16970 [Pirellulales bacterium]